MVQFKQSLTQHCLTSTIAAHISSEQLTSQEYTRQLGVCLMELQDDSQSPAKQQLNRWVMEISSLFAATALSNPNGLKQYHLSKMDEGRICRDDELDESLFRGVMVR